MIKPKLLPCVASLAIAAMGPATAFANAVSSVSFVNGMTISGGAQKV